MEHRRWDDPEWSERAISSRIAGLLRIPEVAAVRYDPTDQALRIRFLSAGVADEAKVKQATAQLQESLETLARLDRRETIQMAVHGWLEAGLVQVDLVRDPATLILGEIYLTVELLREHFGAGLVVDAADPYLVEEQAMAQEEVIQALIADLRAGRARGPLVAIRDDGRLMVYSQ